jgi:SpoVK/Ycf46/Vps4 family AAA+-type ATPase
MGLDYPHGVTEGTRLLALREAVRIAPDDPDLRALLAAALLEAGDADEAIEAYRASLTQKPNDRDLTLGLARAYVAARKTDAAVIALERLAAAAQLAPDALVWYARLLLEIGRPADAETIYAAAIDADPSTEDPELGALLDVPLREPVASGARAQHLEAPVEVERPRVTFADVGGMESVKEEIRLKIIHPLEHPEIYKAYGATAGGGILMYGPPGCGKTFLARATAGEVGAEFLSVGIDDVLDMWIGSSERNLAGIFATARLHKPAVLFFDEVDALAANRRDFVANTGRQVVNQFLAELDGVDASNEGVLILAATNAPWHLDPAFRRPGRFDRVIFVPPPDQHARAAIVRVMLRDKPQSGVDVDSLAEMTDGYSGADLKGLIDLAVERKLSDAIRHGVPTPLSMKDLTTAAKETTPSTREWFLTARNYVVFANQGGLYDAVRPYLKL